MTVAKPVQRTVTDLDEYVGRFVAIDSVEIRARVSGYLDQVHFRDGQMVKQGDLLFTIDKRPFENTLAQTRGTLAQAKANLAFTEADVERARQLVRERTISEQVFDQRTQAFRSAQASVQANEALVRQAQLDVEFTELRAPVAGRIGDRRVSPGNLVAGGSAMTTTLLATIVSLDPIRFEFTMDEASYLRYERLSQSSKEVTGREGGVKVGLKLLDEKGFERSRRDGLRRQRDRPVVGHDPRPRRVREPDRRSHARHVRPYPRAGLAALQCAAGAGRRDRHRADQEVRAGGRRRQRCGREIRHARSD